ncbi:MAG TPA: hypothetical protein VKE97_04505 [Acidimicrobiia bacterium]|nr:hypothetical protein [Acidimicrobiia bacterium]
MRSQSVTGGARFWARATAAVARHPRLWPTALAQAGRLARPRWWRRPPFLPLPHGEYLRHRLETQYGREGEPASDDVVTYLEWCRQMTRFQRRTPR